MPFSIDKFRALIDEHEGDKLTPYRDTKGFLTVGRGFNLDAVGARTTCELLGVDWLSTFALKNAITQQQSDAIFEYQVKELLPMVHHYVPNFDLLSDNRQLAIMDLAWAGIGVLEQFRNMRAAIVRGDFDTAAKEMLDSKWAKDVKEHRANGDAQMLREG